MEYYRNNYYIIWIENNIIWYKLHASNEATGYDIFTDIKSDIKIFKWFEPKWKIFDGEDAMDKLDKKILQIKRELFINNILNDIL